MTFENNGLKKKQEVIKSKHLLDEALTCFLWRSPVMMGDVQCVCSCSAQTKCVCASVFCGHRLVYPVCPSLRTPRKWNLPTQTADPPPSRSAAIPINTHHVRHISQTAFSQRVKEVKERFIHYPVMTLKIWRNRDGEWCSMCALVLPSSLWTQINSFIHLCIFVSLCMSSCFSCLSTPHPHPHPTRLASPNDIPRNLGRSCTVKWSACFTGHVCQRWPASETLLSSPQPSLPQPDAALAHKPR